MKTPILDFVLNALENNRGEWPAIAKGADVPYSTLQKIAQGQSKDPGVRTVQRLYDYLSRQPKKVAA